MMEVKQNTAVDLNELMTSTKSSGTDDAVMTDLTDRTNHDLINCDLIKVNDEESMNIDEVENGDSDITSLIKNTDVDVGVDLNATVNSELEDVLLAEDDVLPEISNSKSIEPTSSVTDDILAEKAETSNSTTSSNIVRDPGDDLDTLLSKINDIVEDCIENEQENTIGNAIKPDDAMNTIDESEKENNLKDETVSTTEKTNLTEDLNLTEEEQSGSAINNICEELEHRQSDEDLTDKDAISSDLPAIEKTNVTHDSNVIEEEKLELAINNIGEELEHLQSDENVTDKYAFPTDLSETQESLNNVEEAITDENNKMAKDMEKDVSEAEAEIDNDKDTDKSNNIDNVKDSNQSNSVENDKTTENNLIPEKSEESNEEIVQDNKITSNSNEVFEAIKSAESTESVENCKVMNSPKATDIAEISKTPENNEDSVATVKKQPIQNKEKTLNDDTSISVNVENDDSDDEIVFYVDKLPEIEKPKETEEKSLIDSGKEITTTTEKSTIKKATSSPEKTQTQNDDDIVLLLDDDDEEADPIKVEESYTKDVSPKTGDEVIPSVEVIPPTNKCTAPDEKDIITDNSDNARDDFITENSNENDKSVLKTEDTETPEENNSNCSSSSNLLQEAKTVKDTVDEPTPEEAEAENEEEEEDGDVELIESELKDNETLDKVEDCEISPPPKRIRLSEDGEEGEETSKKEESIGTSTEIESSNVIEKKHTSEENLEKEKSFATTHSTLKRTHDVIEIETDEKSNDSKFSTEGNNKKQKTDGLKDDVIISEIVDEIKEDEGSEDVKCLGDNKKNLKAVPSYEPIPLYPAPKLETLKSEKPMSLDFLKKFRKSFDSMTKQDLEDLVLQKVVEAIIHRSEFSEMRELIEKQERIINAHRTKISELSKQFRDLEMVHNRVVKDIEQRNSQFIMPVKITRAVGLQVYIPNKKSIVEAPSSTTGPNVLSSPQRPISSQASTTSTSPPQRLLLPSQTETQQQRPTVTAPSGPVNVSNVRRGCVQKITPTRPVPGTNQSASAGSTPIASTVYRAPPAHPAASQPRILNKNAAPTASSTAIQRPRYLGPNQDSQRMATQQQQISRTPNMPANSQRVGTNAATQSKPTSNVATSVPRRSEPIPSQTANSSSSLVDNYINTLTHLTGGNTAVSITPAKPKEKAVIDLTDEDETPSQSAGVSPVTQIPGTQVPRRSLPAQNSSNSTLHFGRSGPSLGRVPPANQMGNNKNRQMSSLQAQNKNSFTSISTPPGTSITRISVAPNTTNSQRVKYSHPAPLPATPPQAFNPSWKLPPPRPTIRISNLDNGIVISWTMEESMDRHAECVSYQIYAYQETSGPPMVDSWRHVGDVKAMLLPMAVTLTQFQEGQRYYFAVRAVDCHQRYGPFSLPKTWS